MGYLVSVQVVERWARKLKTLERRLDRFFRLMTQRNFYDCFVQSFVLFFGLWREEGGEKKNNNVEFSSRAFLWKSPRKISPCHHLMPYPKARTPKNLWNFTFRPSNLFHLHSLLAAAVYQAIRLPVPLVPLGIRFAKGPPSSARKVLWKEFFLAQECTGNTRKHGNGTKFSMLCVLLRESQGESPGRSIQAGT